MTGIIGIDPGLSGAISVILNNQELIVYDMPVVPKPYGKGNMVSPQLLSDIISGIKEKHSISNSIIESVSAMKGQGVSSMFSFGRTLGTIEGVIASHKISINYVTPQKWKKEFGLIGKDKDAARGKVLSLYPTYSDLFKRKKDVDRADATLIGLFGKTLIGE